MDFPIFDGDLAGGLFFETPHDPNSVLDYAFRYKPAVWAADTVYIRGQAVLPTNFCGYIAIVDTSGCSNSVAEPSFPNVENERIQDGDLGLSWIMVPYKFYLRFDEILTSSAWTVTTGATLGSVSPHEPIQTNETTQIWVISIASGITEFTLTNRITTNQDRTDDRSLIVEVLER